MSDASLVDPTPITDDDYYKLVGKLIAAVNHIEDLVNIIIQMKLGLKENGSMYWQEVITNRLDLSAKREIANEIYKLEGLDAHAAHFAQGSRLAKVITNRNRFAHGLFLGALSDWEKQSNADHDWSFFQNQRRKSGVFTTTGRSELEGFVDEALAVIDDLGKIHSSLAELNRPPTKRPVGRKRPAKKKGPAKKVAPKKVTAKKQVGREVPPR